MNSKLKFSVITAALIALPRFGIALDLKNGPFDGSPFQPTVPVIWGASNPVPEHLAVYRIATVKVSQGILSNAMVIGSFKPINLIKSKGKNIIEFRDKPSLEDLTRFLKLSAEQGWIKYNDNRAGGIPPHGVPSFDEIEKQALRYFVLLGGETNQLAPQPWPHNESTFETYDKPGGKLIGKGVSRRSICLFRQIDGIPVMGNSLSVDFGNDARPSMLDMTWPPLNPVQRFRVATKHEMLTFVRSGKAFIQVFPPPDEDITSAKSYKVKNLIPLYAELTSDGKRLLQPYASLLVEADMNGRPVDFVVNCPIVAENAP
jgi:hypothetical protein